MKLIEFLNEKIDFNNLYTENRISGECGYDWLIDNEDNLKNCQEFKNVTDFDFVNKDYIVNENNDLIKQTSINILFDAYSGMSQTIEFGKRCYITSIRISPHDSLSRPNHIENYITTYRYRPSDFSKYREIVLNYSENDSNETIVDRLKQILDNKESYMLKRNIKIEINGFFEYVKINNEEYSCDLGSIDLISNKYTQFRCVAVDTIKGEKRICVDRVDIPTEYYQSILEYSNNLKPVFFTRELLNEYFEKNNIDFKIIQNTINNSI